MLGSTESVCVFVVTTYLYMKMTKVIWNLVVANAIDFQSDMIGLKTEITKQWLQLWMHFGLLNRLKSQYIGI